MGDIAKVLLHVGCANRIYPGFINTDKRDWGVPGSSIMDISQTWPYEDNSVDGIVSMHTLQQLNWRDLVIALKESYRVLKPGGVMRFGCPMAEISDKSLEYLLGWNNINLFSEDLLRIVLVDRIGFKSFRERGFRRSVLSELARVDNRPHRGTLYFEVIK
jgi:predicted SAM-dependent methyltransferase